MIGGPIPDPRVQVLERLNESIDKFFAAGGQATEVEGYQRTPLPARSARVDPETILKRRRRRPSTAERAVLRKLAEDL
ncbi:hypothetical protein ACVI9W_000061 [Pseudomonas sp. 210_17 TE3656]